MQVKARFRDLLSKEIVKEQVSHYRVRIANKLTVKNVILDDSALPQNLASQSPGGLMRILAVDEKNASSIVKLIQGNLNDLKVKSVHIANRAIDSYVKPKQVPLYKHSVIVKLDSKELLKSATSISRAGYDSYLKQEILDGESNDPERIVIDFSSPNIAKPFHFGHLKSTILGNYLANINKFVGNHVTKLCYIGDWGTQYGLLCLGLEEFGKEGEDNLQGTSKSALRYMVDIYAKANERGLNDPEFYKQAKKRFSALSNDDDPKLKALWERIKGFSMDELSNSYSSLGVEFDVYDYESDYAKHSVKLFNELKDRTWVKHSIDGVLSAQVEKNNRYIDVPVVKSDGTSLYLSRDIVAARHRKEKHNFDKMLYVVGADQEKHFHSLKQIVKSLGSDWHDKLTHVKMGKVVGMSSRSGKFVLLSDIIEETTSQYIRATQKVPTSKVESINETEDVAKQLALSALFVYDMRNLRTKNYEFSWDEVALYGKRSGIHLQTTHARLCSLVRKANSVGLSENVEVEDLDPDAVCCVEGMNLLSILDELDNVLYSSFWSMDPAPLVNHALNLCTAINRARRSERLWVLGETDEKKARTRLCMFKSSQMQLEKIIKLLGLEPLYKV